MNKHFYLAVCIAAVFVRSEQRPNRTSWCICSLPWKGNGTTQTSGESNHEVVVGSFCGIMTSIAPIIALGWIFCADGSRSVDWARQVAERKKACVCWTGEDRSTFYTRLFPSCCWLVGWRLSRRPGIFEFQSSWPENALNAHTFKSCGDAFHLVAHFWHSSFFSYKITKWTDSWRNAQQTLSFHVHPVKSQSPMEDRVFILDRIFIFGRKC